MRVVGCARADRARQREDPGQAASSAASVRPSTGWTRIGNQITKRHQHEVALAHAGMRHRQIRVRRSRRRSRKADPDRSGAARRDARACGQGPFPPPAMRAEIHAPYRGGAISRTALVKAAALRPAPGFAFSTAATRAARRSPRPDSTATAAAKLAGPSPRFEAEADVGVFDDGVSGDG